MHQPIWEPVHLKSPQTSNIMCSIFLCYKSLMAEWLEQASQWHKMHCHDLEAISSNPDRVKLGVLSTSVQGVPEPKMYLLPLFASFPQYIQGDIFVLVSTCSSSYFPKYYFLFTDIHVPMQFLLASIVLVQGSLFQPAVIEFLRFYGFNGFCPGWLVQIFTSHCSFVSVSGISQYQF